MSTCHQAHNIPWNAFLEIMEKHPYPNPELVVMLRGQTVKNPFQLAFSPDEQGKVFKKVKFFAAKVHSTIKEFSKTERAKYKNEEIDQITEIYPRMSGHVHLKPGAMQHYTGWQHEDFESCLKALKELFIQEKANSLLYLARKGFPIEKYQFYTYSNFFHYGLSRIKEDCLTLYIHLNLLLASGTLRDPDNWYMQWRRFLVDEILFSYDGNRDHIHMYRDYFVANPNFENMEDLQALLKKLFRTLYMYDMVLAERGVDTNWEQEVLNCAGYFVATTKNVGCIWYKQLEEERKNKFPENRLTDQQ